MRKIETFVPEEGDQLVVIRDLKDLDLAIGDIVVFLNSISMGAICRRNEGPEQVIIPFNALNGIQGNKAVNLTFE